MSDNSIPVKESEKDDYWTRRIKEEYYTIGEYETNREV